MKRLLLLTPAITFAMMPGPVIHPPTQAGPVQSAPVQSAPVQSSAQGGSGGGPSMPVEIKLSPEDKKILDLKKKMEYQQTYNSYRKLKEAETLDEMNLRLSKMQTENSMQQTINQGKILREVPPIVYELPITGTVGNIALTTSIAIPSGARAFNLPVDVKDNYVYIGGLGVGVPPTVAQPMQNNSTSSPSAPSLLTGLPTPQNNPSGPLPPLSSLIGGGSPPPPPATPPGAP